MSKQRFSNNRKSRENRRTAGFTMTEILLVVAILAVLFGVTAVGLVQMQKELRQKELDSKAETIYMVAQNRLTELAASGRSDLYDPEKHEDIQSLVITPIDSESNRDGALYYVSAALLGEENSAAQALMPTSRIDKALRDADWVIEFDPASGSVYAVFYSENSMNYQPEAFNSLRIKKMRLKAGAAVGYYGGDAVVTLDTATLGPEIRVLNEECLHAILSCYAPDGGELTFEITVSDTFGNSVTKTIKRESQVIANKRWVYDLTLDKLTKGERFHEAYPELVPGSDLTICFRAISANDMIDAGSAEPVITNSLFASVQSGTAEITYGRHLQNLDEASGINANKEKLEITTAVQRSHLHFEDDADNNEDWYSLYGAKTYKPIDNLSLMHYDGSYLLSGSGTAAGEQVRCVIYGLQTEKGMFDTFYGDSLCDVTLSGATITGGERAGALAATISSKSDTTVQGCRVYLSAAEGDLTDKTEEDVRIKGSQYVGGLVGYAACGLKISDSFAATVIGQQTSETVGGLVGYAHDTIEISGSYADCYLYGQHVGGLIGGAAAGNSSFKNCYAAGYIYAQKTAAGFLPQEAAHIENAYAVIKYANAADAKAYAAVSACDDAKNLYYIADGGVSDGVGEPVSYETLSKRDTFVKKLGAAFSATTGGDHTFAYNLMNQGLTDYSFPKLAKLAHYGDWAADFQDETPVYYEVYADKADKSYGIFGANLDTLHKEGTAVGDGYGIIYRTKPEKEVTVQYCQKNGKAEKSVTLQPEAAVQLTVGEETYYLLPFAKEIVNTTYAPADFYQPLVIDDTTYYYNPHFACTMTTEKPSQAAALVRIRTARQLHALSRYYEEYAGKTKRSVYMQGLDIDYAAYAWATYTGFDNVSEQEPIGEGVTYAFHAIYDGSGCTISGISFVNKRKDSYDTGMFGDNRGILRDIAIVSEYTGGQDSYIGFGSNIAGSRAVAYGGVLAGRNSRTIRNCAAAGYTLTLYTYRNSTTCVGGLVGSNYGTIRECAAETPRIKLSATYANVKLGGFVGQNNGGISSCYAVADIEVMESRQGSVSTAGFAGENLGFVNTAYCTAAVVTAGSAKGCGFAPVGGTVKRCYYLNGGSYFYIEKLRAYHTENKDNRVQTVTGEELKRLAPKLGSRFAGAEHTAYHQKTNADAAANYPYPAVVRRDNKLVHYGNWVTEAQLGTMGMLYWEHEDGGSNAGYHFRYIGIQGDAGVSGSSLCSAHDDGGIVKAFGYGYYYKNGTTATLERGNAFADPGKVDETASKALAAQINGYTFQLYTTGTTGDSHLYLQENQANGTWTLSMGGAVHQFTLSPFFANAFSYDGCVTDEGLQKPKDDAPFGKQTQPPGSKDNPYQIRSAMQLQYINWNAKNHNTHTAVSATSSWYGWRGDEQNTYFPYLVYVSGNDQSTQGYHYYWEQSHDLDYEGGKDGAPFHPIGSMFYTTRDNPNGQTYIAYFGGSYDGRTYAIKNLEIHADVNMVGLFGVTAGARLQNIVLYSERDNVIEITDESDRWYCVGGLVGFAARGNNNAAQIENCTVSGYKILVSRSQHGWGGGSVGGLAGASNMNLSKCTAVNDIVVSATYNAGFQNIRVGGLVGNLRATVDGAYCGGSIRSTMNNGINFRYNTSVWVGGISGGIVMITTGMANLVGPTDGNVLVKNSYTYVELPASGDHQIQSSHAIASNAEMQQTEFRAVTNPSIRIENCYAYEESVRSTDDYKNKREADYWNGTRPLNKWDIDVNQGRNIWLDNKGKSPYVTYQQLSDQGDDGVRAWLNAKGADVFSFVTTTENGASIDGKYSYAGSDTALEGKNYPFPTVLTQTDTLGRTVCVHYGRWVKGDLYWVGAMQSLDLLDAYDAATKTAAFTLQLKRTKTTDTQEPVYSFIDEDGQTIAPDASILEVISSKWKTDEKAYAVTLHALRTGSIILRATMGDTGAFADVLLNLTAKISLLADPAEIDLSVGDEQEVTLQATSASGKDLTANIEPQIEVDDLNLAQAEKPLYDKDENVWRVKIKGIKAGDTRMSITASYRMTLGTQELEFLERTVVLINVTETPAPPAPPEGGTEPAVPPEGSTEPAKPPEGGSTAGTESDGT